MKICVLILVGGMGVLEVVEVVVVGCMGSFFGMDWGRSVNGLLPEECDSRGE